MGDNEQIDYKDLYNKMERENISLRMFIIKLKNNGSSLGSMIRNLLSDNDFIQMSYGIGIILSFIVLPLASFILELKRGNNEG